MASAPDTLTLETHRDQEGRRGYIWIRRALLAPLALVLGVRLLNAFGERPVTSSAASTSARLSSTRSTAWRRSR